MHRGNIAAGGEVKSDGDKVERSICSLARIDALFMTVMKCLVSEERRSGNRRREYVEKLK